MAVLPLTWSATMPPTAVLRAKYSSNDCATDSSNAVTAVGSEATVAAVEAEAAALDPEAATLPEETSAALPERAVTPLGAAVLEAAMSSRRLVAASSLAGRMG